VACAVREPEHRGSSFSVLAWPQPGRQAEGLRRRGLRGLRVEPQGRTPNKALDRMPGSARATSLQSGVLGALPGIGQLGSLGHCERMDLYAIAPYPKPDFRNDPDTQREVTLRMKAKERRMMRLFITFALLFFASVLFGVLGLPAVTLGGMGLSLLVFVPLMYLVVYAPAPDCPHCGRRMKKDWADLESGRSGEFAICPTCHVYVFTHRTLR